MGFKRSIEAVSLPSGAALASAMVGIGMQVAASPAYDANIEDTLLAVSIEGMENDQLRDLSLLVHWWSVHAAFVNADRLYELACRASAERVRVLWSALARMHWF